jgi:hypothetical protein
MKVTILKENPEDRFPVDFWTLLKTLGELLVASLKAHVFTFLDDGRRYIVREPSDNGEFNAVPDFDKKLLGKPPDAHFLLIQT